MRMGIGLGVGINRSNYAQGIFNAYSARVVADGGVVEAGACVDAVSGLLQSASLLLIPSGYNGGKLYSEIPTNGNGDLTWTRGSDAFRTNASGLIQRVPWNLVQYSEQFNNAFHFPFNLNAFGSGSVANTTATVDPNGSNFADYIQENTSASVQHSIIDIFSGNLSGTTYTWSVFAKAAQRTIIQLANNGGGGGQANYNLTTGVASLSSGVSASMQDVGNGWYRCILSYTSNTSGNHNVQIRLCDASGNSTYTGNGTSGVYIWGAQLVEGTTAQTYLPTTDRLNFPRLSYMYGSCPSALLEPQRTNVVLWSSDLSQSVWAKANYTLTSATAIQGLTATRITKNATNNGLYAGSGSRNVINSVGAFASGTKAFSVLLRKGNTAKVGLLINQILIGASVSASCEFDFATETFTNISSGLTATFEKPTTDVYRLILVVNETGTGTSKALWIAPIDSSNNTVTDGYVDVAYFQWELGAYPTTYIPTTSATATRVADSAVKTGISSLIGQTEGVMYWEGRIIQGVPTDLLIIGTTQDSVFFNLTTTPSLRVGVRTNNTLVINATSSTLSGTFFKIAVAYKSGDIVAYVNGTQVFTNTQTFTFSGAISEIEIGRSFFDSKATQFNQSTALFPTRLTNSQLASLTTL